MKITLLKDVLTPDNGVGHVGDTIEVNSTQAHDYIKAGLAKEASDDAEALPVAPKPAAAGPITTETLRKKPGADRETKTDAPTDTK